MNTKSFFNSKNIIFAAGILFALFVIIKLKDIALLFFAAFVIASAINPVVDLISKKMHRALAVLLVVFASIVISALILLPLIDASISQTIEFSRQLPNYTAQITSLIEKVNYFKKDLGVLPDMTQIMPAFANFGQELVNRSVNLTISFISFFAVIFTLMVVIVYMLLDKEELKQGYLKFYPVSIRHKAEEISATISSKVGGFVIGMLVSMAATAVLTGIGLAILHVKYALMLGILAGLMEIVPIAGPIIAIVPAILVAAFIKPVLALWVIALYSLVQWAGNTFIRPAVFSKFLDIHPLIIILALLIAGSTMGFIGVILAPALAATASVLIKELYIDKINN